uniref:DUF4346 domain-containing protein n=1 Tax=Gracilaria vermiculophylla TaxID=2608709 RepID=A0A345U8V7_9FLOR|nr:hypothetical protein [Gracilaria vermiculophylla]AXI96893.1 hypothetical protein [Gracilaria vermiculophylla]WDZ68041.1 hypothetical protein [Gracilaria vermiculophylla]
MSLIPKLLVFYFKKCSHFRDYPVCFTSDNYQSIYTLLNQHDYIELFSIQHIQYLSKELYKANLCLLLSQTYIQS